jgi:hypothetical protein
MVLCCCLPVTIPLRKSCYSPKTRPAVCHTSGRLSSPSTALVFSWHEHCMPADSTACQVQPGRSLKIAGRRRPINRHWHFSELSAHEQKTRSSTVVSTMTRSPSHFLSCRVQLLDRQILSGAGRFLNDVASIRRCSYPTILLLHDTGGTGNNGAYHSSKRGRPSHQRLEVLAFETRPMLVYPGNNIHDRRHIWDRHTVKRTSYSRHRNAKHHI